MSEETRATNITAWVLSVPVAIIFLIAGTVKLIGAPTVTSMFASWGYPMWFMVITGVLEVAGVIMLLIKRSAPLGAGVLGAVMVGAIVTHLTFDPPAMALVPAVLLVANIAIIYLRRHQLDSWLPAEPGAYARG